MFGEPEKVLIDERDISEGEEKHNFPIGLETAPKKINKFKNDFSKYSLQEPKQIIDKTVKKRAFE